MQHIAAFYAIEKEIRGRNPEERRLVRQQKSRPLADAFEAWLCAKQGLISQKIKLAAAIRCALSRWQGLMRFIDEVPAAAVRVPTYNLAFLPRFAAMSEREFLAFAESKPLRKEFMLAMGRQGFPEKEMDAALDRMRRTYERMEASIVRSGGPPKFPPLR